MVFTEEHEMILKRTQVFLENSELKKKKFPVFILGFSSILFRVGYVIILLVVPQES